MLLDWRLYENFVVMFTSCCQFVIISKVPFVPYIYELLSCPVTRGECSISPSMRKRLERQKETLRHQHPIEEATTDDGTIWEV